MLAAATKEEVIGHLNALIRVKASKRIEGEWAERSTLKAVQEAGPQVVVLARSPSPRRGLRSNVAVGTPYFSTPRQGSSRGFAHRISLIGAPCAQQDRHPGLEKPRISLKPPISPGYVFKENLENTEDLGTKADYEV